MIRVFRRLLTSIRELSSSASSQAVGTMSDAPSLCPSCSCPCDPARDRSQSCGFCLFPCLHPHSRRLARGPIIWMLQGLRGPSAFQPCPDACPQHLPRATASVSSLNLKSDRGCPSPLPRSTPFRDPLLFATVLFRNGSTARGNTRGLRKPGGLLLTLSSTTRPLCIPGQVTQPLCASAASLKKVRTIIIMANNNTYLTGLWWTQKESVSCLGPGVPGTYCCVKRTPPNLAP